MKNFTGEQSEEGVVKFFDEMFNQIAYAAASENNNRKIPKFRDKSNTRGILFTINSKKPNFSKPIVKAFPNKIINKIVFIVITVDPRLREN